MRLAALRAAVPGRRARFVAIRAAYGGGLVGTLGAAGWGVLVAEAKLARRTIGEPTENAPDPDGRYGRGRGGLLRFTLLGDSSAAGLGVEEPAHTTGAQLAGGLARELGRPVDLSVLAVVGGRSADLAAQVAVALQRRPDLALIMIGTNDVTHRVPVARAARQLGEAVHTLRAAGVLVVVGTCPDLGTVQPLLQPLRRLAAALGRRLAAAQTVAVVQAGGVAVTLGDLLGTEFSQQPHLWGPDRFHPSAAGYARVAQTLLPSCLDVLGHRGTGAVLGGAVQDLTVAAAVAARTPGLEVATAGGADGADATGPGRLAQLRRRLPLLGRAAPEPRVQPAPEPGEP